MPDPVQLRDSTQIVLPCETLDGLDVDVEDEFTVTVTDADRENLCRIVGSPVVIKAVSDFLARKGVAMP
jgi:bifunctional DNA-binding transcriptional regulator/antitoxin component of YhaV-PrlF toxin-antitoxin module